MNDKIKEILEDIKGIYYFKPLLDYITNLQQENEELIKNQRYYKNGVFSLEYDKETMSDMIDDYKSRCEKAVEYIMSELVDEWAIKNDGNVSGSDLPVNVITPILDILNGRSDE